MFRKVGFSLLSILILLVSVGYIYIKIKKSQFKEEIKKIKTKSITISPGYLFNSYLYPLSNSKYVLIDTLIPGADKYIFSEMKSRGIKKNQISLIIVTHHHKDHSGKFEI